MSTFVGRGGGRVCRSCERGIEEHDRNFACPRPVSQPLSRVVAGPEQDEEGCGGPREACGKPGCSECGRASSLIADVAAFRALTPEQRWALLQIGADGAALLEAARATVGAPNLKVARDEGRALATVLARIDARRP